VTHHFITFVLAACNTGYNNSNNPLFKSLTFIANILMGAGAIAVTIGFMWAGYLYLTASGDPKELEKAKGAIRNAIVGAILIFGAFALSKGLQTLADTALCN
jgi:hypothetical protein